MKETKIEWCDSTGPKKGHELPADLNIKEFPNV